MVYNNNALDYLHDDVVNLIETLKYHAPKDESLILEKPNVVRNVKPELKKSNLTGRIGILAERKKKQGQ